MHGVSTQCTWGWGDFLNYVLDQIAPQFMSDLAEVIDRVNLADIEADREERSDWGVIKKWLVEQFSRVDSVDIEKLVQQQLAQDN